MKCCREYTARSLLGLYVNYSNTKNNDGFPNIFSILLLRKLVKSKSVLQSKKLSLTLSYYHLIKVEEGIMYSTKIYIIIVLILCLCCWSAYGNDRGSLIDYDFENRSIDLNQIESFGLELDTKSLAIKYESNTTEKIHADLSLQLDLEVTDERSTGSFGWYITSFNSKFENIELLNNGISKILTVSDIHYVSPIFRRTDGGWIAIMPDIMIRFKPEFENLVYNKVFETVLELLEAGQDIADKYFVYHFLSPKFQLPGKSFLKPPSFMTSKYVLFSSPINT